MRLKGRAEIQHLLEGVNPTSRFSHGHPRGVNQGHSGGVVPPIFEPAKPFKQNWKRGSSSHVADDATHIELPIEPGRRQHAFNGGSHAAAVEVDIP